MSGLIPERVAYKVVSWRTDGATFADIAARLNAERGESDARWTVDRARGVYHQAAAAMLHEWLTSPSGATYRRELARRACQPIPRSARREQP